MHINGKLGLFVLSAVVISIVLNIFGIFLFWNMWQPAHTSLWAPLFHTMMLVMATCWAVCSLLSFIIHFSPSQVISLCIFISIVLLSQFELTKIHLPLTPLSSFSINWTVHSLFLVGAVAKNITSVNMTASIQKKVLFTVLGLSVGWGFFNFIRSPWINLKELADQTLTFRDIAITLGFCLPFIFIGVLREYRLDPHSLLRSVRLRLNLENHRETNNFTISFLTLCFGVLLLRLTLTLSQASPELRETISILLTYHPTIYLLAYQSLLVLFHAQKKVQSRNLAAKLLDESALKFLSRHEKSDPTWAAIVGFQSASYVIDHDPQGILGARLPATLQQIRSEEIQRCIQQMLTNTNLHLLELGKRLHGAIDPETCMRPCLDILRLFSCLYLDASPLVERRIKALTILIPVIDPALSSRLLHGELSSLLRKSTWFFFLDYGWLDQRITKSPQNFRYDITIGNHSAHRIMGSIAHQDRVSQFGSCVWITPESRSKIIQEASMLTTIMEPFPLKIGGSGREELFFIMRFEKLIPRLQRYFDLDTLRQKIMDFDPAPDRAQLLGLFRFQIENSKTKEDLILVLKTIQSVPWHGFKEKDAALGLVIETYTRITQLPNTSESPSGSDFQREIYETIQKIGYPSQIFHMAQIAKFSLREVDHLLKTARNPSSPRFAEAWLILATRNYPTEDAVTEAFKFIVEVSNHKSLRERALVQQKVLEIIGNIAQSRPKTNSTMLKDVILIVLRWYLEIEPSSDLLCYLLDTVHFLEHHLNIHLPITPSEWAPLDRYIDHLEAEQRDTPHKIANLRLRRAQGLNLQEVG